ncbi:MAG: IS5 family transposase [Methanogenium sp.]|nr:IS5 family transposase [Methanogenium sp.]
MSSFANFAFKDEYARIISKEDKLGKVDKLIDWECFRPILSPLFSNKTGLGGRPNFDEILMLKMLLLQQWYSLTDPELERQANDRISFRNFLNYPPKIPDRSTIWFFRERLVTAQILDQIWDELQRQIEENGITITRGVIQDASFITSDPGHAKKDKPRGEKAQTRRSKDGEWSKKGNKSYFGYKVHTLIDKENLMIWRFTTTSANVHDSRIDLSIKGETVYRDKGYFGVKPNASMDKTMKRATRNHPLKEKDKRRNKAISRIRSLVELPYAVIKRTFHGGHVLQTTVERVHAKNLFSCFAHNLFRLNGLLQ